MKRELRFGWQATYTVAMRLPFSTPFLNAEFLEQTKSLQLTQPTIVLNVGKSPIRIEKEILASRESSLFQQCWIDADDAVMLLTSTHGYSALDAFPERDAVMKTWSHVHEIFPLPHLKNTQLWRSDKQQIGTIVLNFWFAAKGTDCGIHNEHEFLEIHTQIWGTGHMQKFHEKNPATMYQDILMTPGFTHTPFCLPDDQAGSEHDHLYPWHRYFADTDCVWLAVEYS